MCASVLSSPVRSAVFPTRRTTSSLLSLSNSIQAEKPKKKKENNKYPLAAGLENNETVRVWTRNLSEMSLRASCFFRELRNRIEEASVYLKKKQNCHSPRKEKRSLAHTVMRVIKQRKKNIIAQSKSRFQFYKIITPPLTLPFCLLFSGLCCKAGPIVPPSRPSLMMF